MTEIHVNMDILLSHGYSEFEIDSDRDLELSFRGEGECDAFIRIVHAGKIRIRTFAAAGARINYLFWNAGDQKLEMDESHEVMGGASVTAAYADFSKAPTKRNVYMALREQNAEGVLSSASLVNNEKTYNMQVVNFAPRTYGDIRNYAVVFGKGKLMIDAIGKIVKGASRSESHQTSRALSFEAGQRAEILPELLIDEDDVQASHAMSMGTVDPDQLYYMQSRGLSEQQCISLISNGYLMPITETINNDALKQKLKDELERKMMETC